MCLSHRSRRRSTVVLAGLTGAVILSAALALPASTAVAEPVNSATAQSNPSGLPWSSGAFTGYSARSAEAFASWRGRQLDNIAIFANRQSWQALNDPWILSDAVIPAGFHGDIIVAVPLWPENSSVSANADAHWRTFAEQLAGKDPQAYVRLGWEMNIGQYWQVTQANRDQWITAFHRAAAAMHAVAPGLRIVWNPNWGPDQSGIDSREIFQAVKDDVSVYAIDMYDAWPADHSDTSAAFRWYSERALADSLTYAKANGKPFAVPEWGVGCSTSGCQWAGHAGGDNPRYIKDTLLFLKYYSADIAFDSYFNDPADYIKSELYPSSVNPDAGQAYRAALAQYASA